MSNLPWATETDWAASSGGDLGDQYGLDHEYHQGGPLWGVSTLACTDQPNEANLYRNAESTPIQLELPAVTASDCDGGLWSSDDDASSRRAPAPQGRAANPRKSL